MAIAMPVINPVVSPRDDISIVGHSSATGEKDVEKPMTAPMAVAHNNAINSATTDDFANFHSNRRLPKACYSFIYLFET